MEWSDLLRHRHMTRAFTSRPIDPVVLRRVLDAARHAPSAGFSQGWDLVVLEGPDQTERFWRHATTADWRATSRRRTLLEAPVVVLPLADPRAYLDRYAEPDKVRSGLGQDESAWPVPFWLVDTAFATMLLLLAADEAGLGTAFLGIFRGERGLLHELGVPDGHQPVGAVALGWPAPDAPSPSLGRGRRTLDQVVHRGGW